MGIPYCVFPLLFNTKNQTWYKKNIKTTWFVIKTNSWRSSSFSSRNSILSTRVISSRGSKEYTYTVFQISCPKSRNPSVAWRLSFGQTILDTITIFSNGFLLINESILWETCHSIFYPRTSPPWRTLSACATVRIHVLNAKAPHLYNSQKRHLWNLNQLGNNCIIIFCANRCSSVVPVRKRFASFYLIHVPAGCTLPTILCKSKTLYNVLVIHFFNHISKSTAQKII